MPAEPAVSGFRQLANLTDFWSGLINFQNKIVRFGGFRIFIPSQILKRKLYYAIGCAPPSSDARSHGRFRFGLERGGGGEER
jgi:hypothetical protein